MKLREKAGLAKKIEKELGYRKLIIKYSPVARKKLAQMKKTIGSDKVGIIVKLLVI